MSMSLRPRRQTHVVRVSDLPAIGRCVPANVDVEEEFAELAEVAREEAHTNFVASSAENKIKNRYVNILPCTVHLLQQSIARILFEIIKK